MITARELNDKWTNDAVINSILKGLESKIEREASIGRCSYFWYDKEIPESVKTSVLKKLEELGYRVEIVRDSWIGSHHTEGFIVISW